MAGRLEQLVRATEAVAVHTLMVARPCLQILLVVFVWGEHNLETCSATHSKELRARSSEGGQELRGMG